MVLLPRMRDHEHIDRSVRCTVHVYAAEGCLVFCLLSSLVVEHDALTAFIIVLRDWKRDRGAHYVYASSAAIADLLGNAIVPMHCYSR